MLASHPKDWGEVSGESYAPSTAVLFKGKQPQSAYRKSGVNLAPKAAC